MLDICSSNENTLNLDRLGQYFPYYQPIVNASSGLISGFECLARAYDLSGNVVQTSDILDADKKMLKTRLEIDKIVRSSAIQTFSQNQSGLLFISTPTTWPKDYIYDNIPLTLETINKWSLSPERVVIEISKNSIHSPVIDKLVGFFKDKGVKVAIDNFGLGETQLVRFIDYEPEFIKIDIKHLLEVNHGRLTTRLLNSLSEVAQKSDCDLIIKNIETEQEYNFAMECGAKYVQGELLCEPKNQVCSNQSLRNSLSELNEKYIEEKNKKIKQSFYLKDMLSKFIYNILPLYKYNELENFNIDHYRKIGVLRFYICDLNGKQVSPSYNLTDNGIHTDLNMERYYLIDKPSLSNLLIKIQYYCQQEGVSETYFDRMSKQFCRTYGKVINTNEVFMVDAISIDDSLQL